MINRATLIGNVGKDPDIRRFENGIKASFSLATSETFTPKGGEKTTQTEWHNIVVWGKLAEIVEKYVKKGQSLYVEGKINYRSYDDKDGNKKYITEINAGVIQMLGKKEDAQVGSAAPQKSEVPQPEPQAGNPEPEDDLPF